MLLWGIELYILWSLVRLHCDLTTQTQLCDRMEIEESDEYPDQLKELAEKNSETIDFVYDYPEMKDKKQTIDLSQEAKTDTVPLLLQ